MYIQLPLYVPEQQQEPVQAGVVPVDPDEVHLPQLAQRLTDHMSNIWFKLWQWSMVLWTKHSRPRQGKAMQSL